VLQGPLCDVFKASRGWSDISVYGWLGAISTKEEALVRVQMWRSP